MHRSYSWPIAVLCVFGFMISFGYLVYSIVSHRDLNYSRMDLTPLNTLATVAGTGKVVRIEATASGEPQWLSSKGEQLAFQKLRIIGRLGNEPLSYSMGIVHRTSILATKKDRFISTLLVLLSFKNCITQILAVLILL